MSIAEKLTTVAENMQSVYDKGYADGQSQGGGGEELLQYATNLGRLFHGATFPSGTELTINTPNLKDDIKQFMYYCKGVTKLTLKGNINNSQLNMERAFGGTDLEIVDFTQFGNGGIKPRYTSGIFASSTKLHTILGALDLSDVMNASQQNVPFDACRALENVQFVPCSILYNLTLNSCSLLSKQSIQSIINGLNADVTEQTLTLSSTAKTNAFTDEEWATLIEAKPNWTISLV